MKPENKNLFNVDCNGFFYKYNKKSLWHYPENKRFSAKHIHHCIDILAENGIDTVVVNSNAQVAWYPSKVVETNLDGYKRGDKTFFFGHLLGQPMTEKQIDRYLNEMAILMDRYLDLVENGVDWLDEAAKACRRNKISPWVSIRMNDMHGASLKPEFDFMNCKLFKNPEMRLKGTTSNPKEPPSVSWQGLNYEKKQVRDYMKALIQDCIENYDYEGIELDWTRTPLCCEVPASQEAVNLITNWHSEIRQICEKKAKKTEKPFYMGIRYAGTFEQLKQIGIDIPEMAKLGIIDFVCPTNTWQTSWDIPCDKIKENLGMDISVYGVIELGTNWLMVYFPGAKENVSIGASDARGYRLSAFSPEVLRGNSAGKLILGCDGVEIFNFFCADTPGHWPWEEANCFADYSSLRNLHNVEFLKGKPKFYTFSSGVGFYANNLFETIGQVPSCVEPQCRKEFLLPMMKEPKNKNMKLIIQIVLEKQEKIPDIGVSFNGCWPNFNSTQTDKLLCAVGGYTHHVPEHTAFNFEFDTSQVKSGYNSIVVMNGSHNWYNDNERKQETIRVVSVELIVS
ncbi:MAG TPA: hypothetical protein PLB98_04700 [bacterium]|nr:hypothetical protein [bacterium]HRV05250.1 hypothetical protein [Candidatus Ratteibacteria bacterium]